MHCNVTQYDLSQHNLRHQWVIQLNFPQHTISQNGTGRKNLRKPYHKTQQCDTKVTLCYVTSYNGSLHRSVTLCKH